MTCARSVQVIVDRGTCSASLSVIGKLFIKSGFTAFEPLNHMFYRVGCLGGSGQVGIECLMRLNIYVGRSVLAISSSLLAASSFSLLDCFLVSKLTGKNHFPQ